jgi:hypothetical protein
MIDSILDRMIGNAKPRERRASCPPCLSTDWRNYVHVDDLYQLVFLLGNILDSCFNRRVAM